jgi:hypothetical protein
MSLRPVWATMLIAGTAVLCLASCASSSTPATAGRRQANTPAPSAASQLGASAIDYYFPADGQQFSAGDLFSSEVQSIQGQLTATCLRADGFQAPTMSAEQFAELNFNNTQFPDMSRIARTGLLSPAENVAVSQPSIPRDEQAAFAAASRRCVASAARLFQPLARAAGPLSALWLNDVLRIQASPPIQAALSGFTACAVERGVPARSAGSIGDFLAWESGQETRVAASAAVDVDRRWAKVFLRCAGPGVAAEQKLQRQARAQFLQAHYQQVHQVSVVASQIVGRLAKSHRG